MATKFKYQLSQYANNDLDDYLDYLQNKLKNQTATNQYLLALTDAIDQLITFPFSEALLRNPCLKKKGIRVWPVKNTRIYGMVQEDMKTVYILRILSMRRYADRLIDQAVEK
ncbi:type II toxin-antitoxin system RelE/ParE family toxin [Peptococcus simiae]|uniref:type II toxin-antitoxin system RelE/ParE family toxin n=1 Tax=Peptococcus simiae TaxID=1643805 RepID=UPI0039814DEE